MWVYIGDENAYITTLASKSEWPIQNDVIVSIPTIFYCTRDSWVKSYGLFLVQVIFYVNR